MNKRFCGCEDGAAGAADLVRLSVMVIATERFGARFDSRDEMARKDLESKLETSEGCGELPKQKFYDGRMPQ